MNNNRTGGWMLVAGCTAGLITMALHPVGHRGMALSPLDLARLARLDRLVHGLAIVGVTMILLGTPALAQRLARGNRLSLMARAVYGLAATAIIVAGTLDGFVAADLLERLTAGDPRLDFWWMLLDYNTRIVLAFASVYTVGASAAIFLWSLAILQTRRLAAGLGWYGLMVAPVIVLAVCSGHLALDKHGFGLVMLAHSVWFIVAGCLLMRSVDAKDHQDHSTGQGAGEFLAGGLK